MKNVKLSILCLTFNHAQFIRKALDSFLMQQTNFDFEILIHDDASRDETAKILHEYKSKYPDIIELLIQKENQYFTEKDYIKTFISPFIKGQYVALCEGDDYWTDPLKLQKQVDFLDAHPECSICFHPVKVVWEDKSQKDRIFPTPSFRFRKKITTLQDLLKHNYIQTNSVVYRWRFHKDSLNLIPDDILPGDYFLHLLHAQTGKIGFIDDVMAVYRKHAGGLWNGAGKTDEWFSRCGYKHMNFYRQLEKHFNISMREKLIVMAAKCLKSAHQSGNIALAEQIQVHYPKIYNLAIHLQQEKEEIYWPYFPLFKIKKSYFKSKIYFCGLPFCTVRKEYIQILGIKIRR